MSDLEETLISVWRQSLIDGAKSVEIRRQTLPGQDDRKTRIEARRFGEGRMKTKKNDFQADPQLTPMV